MSQIVLPALHFFRLLLHSQMSQAKSKLTELLLNFERSCEYRSSRAYDAWALGCVGDGGRCWNWRTIATACCSILALPCCSLSCLCWWTSSIGGLRWPLSTFVSVAGRSSCYCAVLSLFWRKCSCQRKSQSPLTCQGQ